MHTADQPAPTPRTDANLRGWKDEVPAPFAEFTRQLERELSAVREALTGEDYASLPSDIPTVRMAHGIRSDRDKFLQQVRDTCSRAEKAERELSIANKKADEEMLRVKACEHIADGDEGWEQLRNECPSTASVAAIRDELSAAKAEAERLREALLSISKNTCCEGCQEAKRVALSALAATRKDPSNG